MFKKVLVAVSISLLWAMPAFAKDILITNDTGTQGKGNALIEVNSEFAFDKERADGITTKERGGEAAAILSYGITDHVDIILGLPYQWKKTKEDGVITADPAAQGDGFSDISLEAKWKFLESKDWSLALKPGIAFPSGDEKKGLGPGKMAYALTFVTTKEMEPWAFHFNLGYTQNEYKLQEDKEVLRKGIWQMSLASEVEVAEGLSLIGNIGLERNEEKGKSTHPAFILGGINYSISKSFDVNLGIKGGLNKPETDLTFLAGIAWRF